MKALQRLAVTGTRHGADARLATGSRLDELLKQTDADTERRILLTAGSWDVLERAGRIAPEAPELPEPAAEETRELCRRRVASIVRQLLDVHGSQRLLIEAGRRLDAARQRLPPELLPDVLELADEALRRALRGSLGERGRWLSRFRPEWSWAAPEAAETSLADAADEIWELGAHPERLRILRQARRLDPERARNWLADVWGKEKVRPRLELLDAFRINLSSADEPFLESCLGERSIQIRSKAADFLLSLPGSALAVRMRERAERLLSVERGRGRLTLKVTLPEEVPKSWENDGVRSAVPAAVALGPRAFWFSQILRQVPPRHWASRLDRAPEALLAAASAHEWAAVVGEAWTIAAARFRNREWLTPLWDWWLRFKEGSDQGGLVQRMLLAVIRDLPAREREPRLTQLVGGGARAALERSALLEKLPVPWPVPLARTWLRAVRRELRSSSCDAADELWPHLNAHAGALPPELFDEALRGWPEPHVNWWASEILRRQLGRFRSTIELRQTLYRETRT